ncbi:hypothetical protein [Novosphingobium album (ex Liu et al. 2023)]|uniref:MoaD/ThiS family protein n=1 Tax=Novosphingobium album (ex Liu et al. 2023) TaxID=3031130 RepID=A0ABT5WMV7_9SPHN|nr:hypothetical protein [Novosphingobium album (ex Liu et al. 2023)]MDE8651041.1 hypothetical protein [Novosphingobium album (ex Liu et al. 2023)]
MRIVIMPPFDREFFGTDRLDLAATNLFDLVGQLDALAPGFATIAQVRATFAIDGVVTHDWASPLANVTEVILLPRVGGG